MTLGRSLLLEKIRWTEEGWFCPASSGPCDQPMRKPAGKRLQHDWALSDDFSSAKLKITWKMLNHNDFSRVQTCNGELILRGEGEHPGCSPLVIAAGDTSYVCSVELDHPEAGEAGLVLVYSTLNFVGIGWNGKILQLYRNGRSYKQFELCAKHLRLFLRNLENDVAFYYKADDCDLIKINNVMAVGSMNATAYGGFSSLRPGLFATDGCEAVFCSFRYETESAGL
jgi:beta-xylosidase